MLKEFHSYPCKHCGKRFTILPTQTGQWLPAEWIDGKRPVPVEFDPNIHTSHLKNCPGQASNWINIKKKLEQQFEDKTYGGSLLR